MQEPFPIILHEAGGRSVSCLLHSGHRSGSARVKRKEVFDER
jgi:hypothetical protein